MDELRGREDCEDRLEWVVWYRDLVVEMTGHVPQVRATTVLHLMDGQYWHVRQVEARIPAFGSPMGMVDGPVVRAETEAGALRALCECVHALVWREQEAGGAWDGGAARGRLHVV